MTTRRGNFASVVDVVDTPGTVVEGTVDGATNTTSEFPWSMETSRA